MAIQPREGLEPIPGYRLVRRLGRGGYGEVWECTAPGDLHKAIKFVFGDLSDARAGQEFRSLERIKAVRHPFLLSIERFEVIDGQLIIVSELAEGSVKDRFDDCRLKGQRGIPREELLLYLTDAADALDYMCGRFGLQHLDIKPQNLLLVGGRIKVADFGLVKDLEGQQGATATGGVTPIYATPEAFDGRVSRQSDQYSLAIVYQEMLTGVRPFPGQTALQLAVQHMKTPPMLDCLPPAERPVIARALAKTPEDRYPSCKEMVQALRAAAAAAPESTPTDFVVPQVADPNDPFAALSSVPRTQFQPVRLVPLVPKISESATLDEDILDAPTMERAPNLGSGTRLHSRVPERDVIPGEDDTELLRPTLVIGVGRAAGYVLSRLKGRILDRFGATDSVAIFRSLLLDLDRESLRGFHAMSESAALVPEETMAVPLRRMDDYRDKSREILRWLDRRWFYSIPPSGLTEGRRPLGRLAFLDNIVNIRTRLERLLEFILSPQAAAHTAHSTGLGLRTRSPRVFVVASIDGGTGSGMLMDLGYLVQQLLLDMGQDPRGVCGYLLHNPPTRVDLKEVAKVNAFATLTELNHFADPTKPYPGSPADGLMPMEAKYPPFHECYLQDLGDNLDGVDLELACDGVAEYLYLDMATAFGRFIDDYRERTHSTQRGGSTLTLRSYGMYRLTFPRYALANLSALLIAEQVVRRWYRPLTPLEHERITQEIGKRGNTIPLEAAGVVREFQRSVAEVFNDDIERECRRIVVNSPLGRLPNLTKMSPTELSQKVMEEIDSNLGTGRDPHQYRSLPLSKLERELRDRALHVANQRAHALKSWLVGLVDQQQYRLASAQYAVDHYVDQLMASTSQLNQDYQKLQRERQALRGILLSGQTTAKSANWLLGRRNATREELEERFIAYARLRVHEIILEKSYDVLRFVLDEISQLAHELSHTRQVLQDMAHSLVETSDELSRQANETTPPGTMVLLPGDSLRIDEAAHIMLRELDARFVDDIDRTFLAEGRDADFHLTSLARAPSDVIHAFEDRLVNHIRRAVLTKYVRMDATSLLLSGDNQNQVSTLLGCLNAAQPRLPIYGGWQHLIVTLPPTDDAAPIRKALADAAQDTQMTVLPSDGDLILCYETANLSIPHIAQHLIGGQATYAELANHLLTRRDVIWTQLTPYSS